MSLVSTISSIIWLSLLGIPLAHGEREVRTSSALNSTFVLSLYWESYLTFPHTLDTCLNEFTSDSYSHPVKRSLPYAFRLTDILDDIGLSHQTSGKLIISIAYAHASLDFCYRRVLCREIVCGLHLYEELDRAVFESLVKDIEEVQRKGVLVLLAFGGEEYGNLMLDIKTRSVADTITEIIVDSVDTLGVDGVDLVQYKGCGSNNFECNDLVSIQLYFIERLRERIPDKIIGYTFPSGYYDLNYPFRDVIRYGSTALDFINVFGTNPRVFDVIKDNELPKEKILLGFPIGCNQDPFRNFTLADAQDLASKVKSSKLKGISVWSTNKDTSRRVDNSDCNEYQSGNLDGNVAKSIWQILFDN